MFQQKNIDAYKKIEAPSSLKSRILNDCNNSEKKSAKILKIGNLYRKIASIAACLLLMVAVFSFMRLNTSNITLTYDGATISEDGISFDTKAASRQTDAVPQSDLQITLPINLLCKKESTVNVNTGTLFITDESDETTEPIDENTVFSGEIRLLWIFDSDEQSPELTVNYGSKQSIYSVQISENSPTGHIYKKQ